jgi:hypothetical protein
MTIYAVFLCTTFTFYPQLDRCGSMLYRYDTAAECKTMAARLDATVPHERDKEAPFRNEYVCLEKTVPTWQPAQ